MGKRKSRGNSKSDKSKKHKEKNSRDNIYAKEEENSKNVADEVYDETVIKESEANYASDLQSDASASKTSSDKGSETNSTDTTNNINTNTDIADCCEEIKVKQEELFNRLKNLSESLVAITLIRDDVNSLRVDTLTELYFTRQVRPLLDALNIISFATNNISTTATSIQTSAFGDVKEIKNALKLSYKMNDEIDDIINSLGRRLTIFLKEINNMDKNCPPFYSGKDS